MTFNASSLYSERAMRDSSVSYCTYLPTKKNAGMRARSGIMNDLDIRFMAQRRRMTLAIESGTKRIPVREINHTFAGLTTIDAYDRTRSPATASMITRDVSPKNQFLDMSEAV